MRFHAGDVSVAERIVRLRGHRYRYQEITPAEVLRLLEKPNGTIPIHRITPAPDTKSLEDLVAGDGLAGVYCNGDTPSMADVLLIPQVYNARRFGLDRWPS